MTAVILDLSVAWLLTATGFLTFAIATTIWTKRARHMAVVDAAVALADSDEPVDEPVVPVLRKVS